MNPAWWQTVAAIYAAIVATGALFLEVRRWAESGARIAISVWSEAILLNVPGHDPEETYISVTVVNRGSSPTTITNFGLMEFRHSLARVRRRSSKSAIVTNPAVVAGMPGLPHVLVPGAQWQGMARHNDELVKWMDSGKLYVAIFASHSDRAAVQPVPKRKKPDQAAGTTGEANGVR